MLRKPCSTGDEVIAVCDGVFGFDTIVVTFDEGCISIEGCDIGVEHAVTGIDSIVMSSIWNLVFVSSRSSLYH